MGSLIMLPVVSDLPSGKSREPDLVSSIEEQVVETEGEGLKFGIGKLLALGSLKDYEGAFLTDSGYLDATFLH